MSSKVKCVFCFKSIINGNETSTISNTNIIKFLCKQLNVDFNIFENDSSLSTSTLVLPLCTSCNILYAEELIRIYEILQNVKGQLKILMNNVTKEVSESYYEQEDSEEDATLQAKATTLFRDEVIRSANVFVKLEFDPEEVEEFDGTTRDEMDQVDEVKVETVFDDVEMDDNAEDINSDKDDDEGSDGPDVDGSSTSNSDTSDSESSTSDSDSDIDTWSTSSSSTSDSQDSIECEVKEDSQPVRKKLKMGDTSGKEAKTRHKLWKCEICEDVTFRHEKRLRMHNQTFHDSVISNYLCNRRSCDKKFSNNDLYKKHIKFHDNVDKHPDRHNCQECELLFKTEKGWTTHQEKHRTSKTVSTRCRFCNTSARYPSAIRKHEVEKHIDQLTHVCSICPEKYSSSSILETHLKTHAPQGPYSCSICKDQPETEKFSSAKGLENHLVRYHIPRTPQVIFPKEKEKENLPCETCGRIFQGPQRLKNHIKTHHHHLNKSHKLICELCPKVSLTQTWMTKHAVECHENVESTKTFVCTKCPKSFVTNFMFEKHIKRHEIQDKKPFSCEICEACFVNDSKSPGGLQHHMKIHHEKPRLECRSSGCNKSFGVKSNRNRHEREMHPELLIYCCTLCDKMYQEKELLDTHVKIHGDEEPPLTCEVCKSGFVTRDILALHLISHTGEKGLKCPHCPKLFRYRKGLDEHVLVSHTGEKPHECEVCKKKFVNKFKLNSHFEVHHGGPDGNGVKFFCDMCDDKSYTTKKQLSVHKKRDHGLGEHKPERKVICDICGKSLIKSFLKTHIKIHEGTVELKQICKFCGKGFRTGFELKQHTLTHTGEKPYTCHICQKGFTQSHSWKSHMKVHEKNGTYTDP